MLKRRPRTNVVSASSNCLPLWIPDSTWCPSAASGWVHQTSNESLEVLEGMLLKYHKKAFDTFHRLHSNGCSDLINSGIGLVSHQSSTRNSQCGGLSLLIVLTTKSAY